MRANRIGRLVAVTVSSLVLLSACTPAPNPTTTPTPTSTQTTPSTVDVSFYWVSSQPTSFRLMAETQSFPDSVDVPAAVIAAIVDGSAQPLDPDYVNLWGDGWSLNSLTIDGTIASVDLTKGRMSVGAEAESRAIGQIVWTLTQLVPSVTGVQFLIDGKEVDSIAGHVDTYEPIGRGDPNDVLSAVAILTPVEGSTIPLPVKASGEACVFEANVSWELMKGDVSIASGSTMASQACPVRSPWSLDLGSLDVGTYVLFVRELSAKDGSVTSEDSKTFVVE